MRWVTVLVVACLGIAVAQEAAPPQPSKRQAVAAEHFFLRGLNRSKAKRYPEALAELEKSITAWPTTKALRTRAAIYMGQGNIELAMQDFAHSIRLEPADTSHYRVRAIALQLLGDNEAAIADYSKIIELTPKSYNAWGNRGLARMNIGDLAGALADFDEALSLHPKYDLAYYNRGLAHFRRKDYQQAEVDFQTAVQLKPDWEDALVNLRITQQQLKVQARAAATKEQI